VGHMVHLLIPHAADPSFPSDHATLAFSLAFSLLFANRRVGLLMLGLALITGISRVYVGVHYPGDILGAMALSLAAAYLVWKLRTRLDRVPAYFIRLYRKLTRHLDFLPRPE
jgi:undecaprenyl-diphosphatase